MTPRIVSVQGVNTPPNVPNFEAAVDCDLAATGTIPCRHRTCTFASACRRLGELSHNTCPPRLSILQPWIKNSSDPRAPWAINLPAAAAMAC